MNTKDLSQLLACTVLHEGTDFGCELRGGYTSDLLSDVMGHAQKGMIWITLQTHRNTIAVASFKEIAAILLVQNRVPSEEALIAARTEGITLISTPLSAFEASGLIYEALK